MPQDKSLKIKNTLEQSGISQTDLAKKLGISRQQLHGILKENRKSKYLDQIAALLKLPEVAKDHIFNHDIPEPNDVQRLPLVLPEDILRIWEGRQNINLLHKPFYKEWPFTKQNHGIVNHFALHIQDPSNTPGQLMIGAFHLFLPLTLTSGHWVLIYLQDLKKLIVGRLEINPETQTRILINNKGIYPIGVNDILMAECTQMVTFLE